MPYGLVGKFTAQPGKRDELAALLLRAAELLGRNGDCIHYLISTADEAEAIWVTETWTTKAAHDASLEPAEVRALIAQARPLIAAMSEQRELHVLGGKGL